jgi:hypothetical protein
MDRPEASPRVGQSETLGRSRRDRRRSSGRWERSTVLSTSGTALFDASPVTLSAALTRMGQAGAAELIFGAPQEAPAVKPATAHPVFITGGSPAQREALALALAPDLVRGSGPSGGLEAMAQALDASRMDLLTLGYPEQYWYKTAADEFAVLHAVSPDEPGRRCWLELVDGRALPVGMLDRLFPRCLVIKIVKPGFFPRERWERKAGLRLSSDRYHEIRAADVRRDPQAVRAGILDFIAEAAPPV